MITASFFFMYIFAISLAILVSEPVEAPKNLPQIMPESIMPEFRWSNGDTVRVTPDNMKMLAKVLVQEYKERNFDSYQFNSDNDTTNNTTCITKIDAPNVQNAFTPIWAQTYKVWKNNKGITINGVLFPIEQDSMPNTIRSAYIQNDWIYINDFPHKRLTSKQVNLFYQLA